MMDKLKGLLDLGESYGLYVILGTAMVAAAVILDNIGDFGTAGGTLDGLFFGLSNFARAPGRLLFLMAFVGAAVAGDQLPTSLRITCMAVSVALFLKFVYYFEGAGIVGAAARAALGG